MLSTKKCEACDKYTAVQVDYRCICNIGGKILLCKYCLGLNDKLLKSVITKNTDPKGL